jgi:methionine salvage enolase-phosphatase E1
MEKHQKAKVLVFTEDLANEYFEKHQFPETFNKKIKEAGWELIFITSDVNLFCQEKLGKISPQLKKLSLINLGPKKGNGFSLAAWAQIIKTTGAKSSEIILISNSPADFSPARRLGINFILVSRGKKSVPGEYPILNSLMAL